MEISLRRNEKMEFVFLFWGGFGFPDQDPNDFKRVQGELTDLVVITL